MGEERSLGRAPAEGELLGVRLGDRHIALARIGGVVHALDACCNHAGCLLSEGLLLDDGIMCPCHAVVFRLRDGRVLTAPRICEDQQVVSVQERDGEVHVIGGKTP